MNFGPLFIKEEDLVIYAHENVLEFKYGVEHYKCAAFRTHKHAITITVLEGQNILAKQLMGRVQEDMEAALNYVRKIGEKPRVPEYKKPIVLEVMTHQFRYVGCFPSAYRLDKGVYEFQFSYDYKEPRP